MKVLIAVLALLTTFLTPAPATATHRASWTAWSPYWVTGYCTGYRTATGTVARWGELAVDPAVIPLGATVQVRGLGHFHAEDTGGDIKGHWLDIYTTCSNAYAITGWWQTRWRKG